MGAPAAGNTPPASQRGGGPHIGVWAAGAAGGRWSPGLGLRLGLVPTYSLAPAPGWPRTVSRLAPHCLLAPDKECGLLGTAWPWRPLSSPHCSLRGPEARRLGQASLEAR